jgi:hypothetical protein
VENINFQKLCLTHQEVYRLKTKFKRNEGKWDMGFEKSMTNIFLLHMIKNRDNVLSLVLYLFCKYKRVNVE